MMMKTPIQIFEIIDTLHYKLTQNPPIIPLNPPVSGANAANNFWKVSVRAILDHVWPNFTYSLARAL